MDKKYMRNRNTADINRVSARCLRVIIYFLVLFYTFIFVIKEYDVTILSVSFGACVIFALIPAVLISIFKQEGHGYIRHVIVWCTTIISTILITQLNSIAYPFILFPTLISSLYYNRTFVLCTSMLMNAGILGSAIFQIYFPELVLNPQFTGFDGRFVEVIITLLMIEVIMSFVAFFIVDRNSSMIDKYIDTAMTMQQNENYLIYAFSEISETKSKETGEHIRRVAEYMKVLGRASGFDMDYCEKLAAAAMMHDIGKLMIPEEILDKPTRLTEDEYQIMKNHVLYGEALLKDCPGEIMQLAATLAKEHHERWDGKGYLGMKETEIAYIARLITVCDVFDALTTTRSYKKGWTIEESYNEIVKNSGTQFDPEVVRLFIANFDQFREIHERIPDKQIY